MSESVTLETVTKVAEPRGEVLAWTVEDVDQGEAREDYPENCVKITYLESVTVQTHLFAKNCGKIGLF